MRDFRKEGDGFADYVGLYQLPLTAEYASWKSRKAGQH